MHGQLYDRKILAALTAGHIVDDIYMNALPPFLPVLIATSGLSFASAGMLVTLFTVTSSLSQPFLGYAIDRYRMKWTAALGLIWAGIFFGLMGAFRDYTMLLLVSTLAGIGPALFHPHALSLISGITTGAKGRVMAIFIIGGNIGFAISPLLIGALTDAMGQKGMFFSALPGLIMGAFIWKVSSQFDAEINRAVHPVSIADFKPAVILIVIVVLRSWVFFSVLSYLPSYFVHLGSSMLQSNSLVSLMLLSGIAGQFAGGSLSDRFGRRRVTMVSLLSAAPALYAFLHTAGPFAMAFLLLFGFMVMASFSVTMVMLHEIMPRHIGMASGIMIGFALGVGGMGVMVTGMAADRLGLAPALTALVIALAAAGFMTRFAPSRTVGG